MYSLCGPGVRMRGRGGGCDCFRLGTGVVGFQVALIRAGFPCRSSGMS